MHCLLAHTYLRACLPHHSHRLVRLLGPNTMCCAAHYAHKTDTLCEIIQSREGTVVAYRFYFIDRAGFTLADADQDDDDDEMEVSDDEGLNGGAIAFSGPSEAKLARGARQITLIWSTRSADVRR